jgi:hypothetical protein
MRFCLAIELAQRLPIKTIAANFSIGIAKKNLKIAETILELLSSRSTVA